MNPKLSEDKHRTTLINEINSLLKGTGYEAINSQSIQLPENNPLVIKYGKTRREFDILILKKLFYSDTMLDSASKR